MKIRLLRQPVNMGKRSAIQAGCFHARGKLILMVEFGELENRLLSSIQSTNIKQYIMVGSRAHIEKAQRTILRNSLGLGFHMLALISDIRDVHNTQCGYKFFQEKLPTGSSRISTYKDGALILNYLLSVERRIWQLLRFQLNEIEGSKMKITGMIKIAIDLLQIAEFHRTGL